MKRFSTPALLLAAIVACATAHAQPQQSIDDFLKSADLKKINSTDRVVNLIAQLHDPDSSVTRVSDFNDFIAISTITDNTQTIVSEFDGSQKIVNQRVFDLPWMGVTSYTQKDIPALTLQEGFDRLKACMKSKGEQIPDTMTRAIIYKAVFGQQFVYDYVLSAPIFPQGVCQEVLYNTETNECDWGMVVNCRFNVDEPFIVGNKIKK